MTELFNKIIPIILHNEGGLVNDPDDSGGETKYGISKKYHPDVDIASLTIDKAKEIYFNEYWKPLKLDQIKDENIALQIFDFAVNAGISKAVRTAQELTCVHIDGIMGPETIAQINNLSVSFLPRYIDARKKYYRYLVKVKPANIKFLAGWINRAQWTQIT